MSHAPSGRAAGPSAREVRSMFSRIAGRYDLMNTLMTGGRDRAWRRLAARAVAAAPPGPVLDLATGTGDLALAIHAADAGRSIVAADFADAMLARARPKLAAGGAAQHLVVADALALPFPDAAFAAVASAFLLRNLANLSHGLAEMRRVTRPGGRLVALDILRPPGGLWGRCFALYFRRVVPAVGSLVAGDRRAYAYLPASAGRFLDAAELVALVRDVGFVDVAARPLGLGTLALVTATA